MDHAAFRSENDVGLGSLSFRGSITRPGDSLCTLRSQGHPCTTQHSVPAGCQPLPGRITNLPGPTKRFRSCHSLHNFPLFQALPGALSAETSSGTGRATALVHIAEHYLATGGSGAKPLTSHEAYQVLVHVNANDAHPDNRIQGGHTCHDQDGRCLAPPVVRQLACDATRTTVLENDRGAVLNIGRRSRVVPRRIAQALRIRDGGCRFPGCGQRRWTDAHHIRHWMDGGETSLDNLITLCRFHHRSLHRGEYWIERGAGSEVLFRDPQNRCIETSPYPQFKGSMSVSDRLRQLRNEHDRQGLQIDADTAVTAWAGEVMDDAMAIEGLLQSDGVVLGAGSGPP